MSDFEEMRTFVQLVEAGTATRAAEQRGVAVSAISRRMKDLETRLGVQLLQRTTRRMHLTQEGRYFYEASRRILDDLEEAEAEVTQHRSALGGVLNVAAPVSFGVAHLSPVLARFMALHPGISVKADLSDRQVDLVNDGFDLAIRIAALKDSTLMARKIGTFRHMVCAAPAFFEAHGVPQHPRDLTGWPGLCYANLATPSLWSYRGPDGDSGQVRVATRYEATNGEALRAAAIAGLGVLCEPSFIVHKAVADGTLQAVLPAYRWHDMAIYAVYPATRHVPARVRALIDFLTECFGDTPYWESGSTTDPT